MDRIWDLRPMCFPYIDQTDHTTEKGMASDGQGVGGEADSWIWIVTSCKQNEFDCNQNLIIGLSVQTLVKTRKPSLLSNGITVLIDLRTELNV